MKLPKIGPVGGTARLQTISPSLVASEGAGVQGFAQAMMGVGVALQESIDRKAEDEDNARGKQMLLEIEQDKQAWDVDNVARDSYDINEIDYELKAQLGITEQKYPDGKVPGHIVKSGMLNQRLQKSISSKQGMVSDPGRREHYTTIAQERAVRHMDSEILAGVRGAELYYKQQTVAEATNLETAGQFGAAEAVYKDSTLDPSYVAKQVDRLRGLRQNRDLNSIWMSGNVADMTVEFERIKAEDPGTVGNLETGEVAGWYGKYKTALDNQNVGANRLQVDLATTAIEQYKKGPALLITKGQADSMDAYLSSDPKLLPKLIEFQDARIFSESLPGVMSNSLAGMKNAAYDNVKKRYPKGGPNAARMKSWYDGMLNEAEKLIPTDPMEFTERFEQAPMQDFNINDIPGSVAGRMPIAAANQAKYGSAFRVFKNSELPQIVQQMSGESATKQIEMGRLFGISLRGNPEAIDRLVTEIDNHGGLSHMPALIRNVLDKNSPKDTTGEIAARRIAFGSKVPAQSRSKILSSDTQKELDQNFMEHAKGAFITAKALANAKSAFISSYVGQAYGDMNETGEYISDWADVAKLDAVGPTVEIGNVNTFLPSRYVTPQHFRDQWQGTPASEFKTVTNADGQKLAEGMADGSVVPMMLGRNEYILVDADNNSNVVMVDDKPYVWKFDPNRKTSSNITGKRGTDAYYPDRNYDPKDVPEADPGKAWRKFLEWSNQTSVFEEAD